MIWWRKRLCLLSNHWHLVLRPRSAKDLARFMRWVCTAHVRRHHAHYHSPPGHLYQGRYKSFPVRDDHHLLTLLRYVESNALRAGLCASAGACPWCSDAMRQGRQTDLLLSDWPVKRPGNWSRLLEERIAEKELARLRTSVNRGRPYGTEQWVQRTARRLGLTFTLRARGRPKAKSDANEKLCMSPIPFGSAIVVGIVWTEWRDSFEKGRMSGIASDIKLPGAQHRAD
jgi:putative transposase